MDSQIQCNCCGNLVSRLWTSCPKCKFDLSNNNFAPSQFNPSQSQISNPTKDAKNVINRVGDGITEWMYNYAFFGNSSAQNHDFSEYEEEYSDLDEVGEDYSAYLTDPQSVLHSHQRNDPANQPPSHLTYVSRLAICNDPATISCNYDRGEVGSSFQYSNTSAYQPANDTPSKRSVEIQTDMYTSLTRSRVTKDQATETATKDQTPFLYRLAEDEAKPKKFRIRRPNKLIRSNSDKDLANLQQMTQSTPPRAFEDLRAESSGRSSRHYPATSHFPISSQFSTWNQHQVPVYPSMQDREQLHWMTHLLNPDATSSFLRLLFNTMLGFLFCFVLYSTVVTIRGDLSRKQTIAMERVHLDIGECRRNYTENRCDPETRVRALESYCVELEKCLAKDPETEVQKSYLTAELIAHILNSFVAPLDLKTIIFIFLLIFGMILICNCSLVPWGSNHAPHRDYRETTTQLREIHQRLYSIEQHNIERSISSPSQGTPTKEFMFRRQFSAKK